MARESIFNGARQLAVERSGLPSGRPVLFLHGITASAETWQESTARLGASCDCWALDFTGHGQSDRCASSPTLSDYAADAAAVLQRIGTPSIVVGHSLGGITAAHLGHERHPLVKALLLVDPPLFLGDREAFHGTVYPKLFAMVRETVAGMQAKGASADDFVDFTRSIPSPMGGVLGDHTPQRHVLARAHAYQQVDPTVLDSAISGALFEGLDPYRRIDCPVTLLAANEDFGAAVLAGDADRLRRHSPHAEVIDFPEVGHGVYSSSVSEARFLDVLERFVAANG